MWFKLLKRTARGPANLLVKDFLESKNIGDTFTVHDVKSYGGNLSTVSIGLIRSALNRHTYVSRVPNTKPMQYTKKEFA